MPIDSEAVSWVMKGFSTFVFAILAWIVRMLHGETKENKRLIDQMERNMTVVKVDIASNYVNKQEFKQFRDEIRLDIHDLKGDVKDGFTRLEKKLDK